MFDDKSPIIIGCDHAGFTLKEQVKCFLVANGIKVEDVGTNSDESVDYSDYGIKVASAISKDKFKRGILICGTGIGMCMVANRFPHVRAALCNHLYTTMMSRRHNNSNILVMGGRVIGEALALEMLKIWLEAPFEGDRHQRRLDKFDRVDTENA